MLLCSSLVSILCSDSDVHIACKKYSHNSLMIVNAVAALSLVNIIYDIAWIHIIIIIIIIIYIFF